MPTRTLHVFYNDDYFEVIYSRTGVESITRYRNCQGVRGEIVDFDLLALRLQERIINQLRTALRHYDDDDRTSPTQNS